MRTQVGIVGAGPAGLFLAHMLQREGIESVVLEAQPQAAIEGRVRAGVLEHAIARLLVEAGLGDRMEREGLVHHGIGLLFGGAVHRINFAELLDGRGVVVWSQHEVVKDLIAARRAAGGDIRFEVSDVTLTDIESKRPSIHFRHAGHRHVLSCDVIAGCDGFHGVARPSIPPGALQVYERILPLAWLGILAAAPPPADELIYAHHPSGFALASMRSQHVARLFFQVNPDENLGHWSDARIWDELDQRLAGDDSGIVLTEGAVLQKSLTTLRAFVAEPMRYGRLFLAGDAAHVVPPTGAKGMNLAIAGARVLARGLTEFFKSGDASLLERYSDICLNRAWAAQRFSWWMTQVLHRNPRDNAFDLRRQLADLEHLVSSRAAAAALAEVYVGPPLERL
ncbi:4-hydroxybenzoate 3-monooxygenase [Blastochloris viridis]|uniref:p-hydroxybenzoate hydroxylase n=1 Tax=Blastochloris viridis TaxID=1079 RepID=A0A0H5BCS6_BLAVI|nr:4-hydroxybenzoate 3-monooxygenase [Blastochloris viridis]ALK10052.1 p-hydroxybenzoate hydroxylase [Blastochloris viridis]BAS00028.1 P-hydroxybenzoate hydroxylase [Blastochloris viridis]CUU42716.1 p-hydroxybenzoate hydroxylase [Blastochloris viridis]